MKNIFLFILIFLSLYGKSQSKAGGTLLLKSGFENGVSISGDLINISGSDVAGYSWTDVKEWVSSTRFQYIVQSTPLQEYQESVIEKAIGPKGNETKVLRLINKKNDPATSSTSRTEFSFYGKSGPDEYKEGYVRYWLKLQDNLPELVDLSTDSPWYMIMEWKEPNSGIRNSASECEAIGEKPGGSNNYRININAFRYANSTDLYWQINGEHPQPCRAREWTYINQTIKVPLGEWFLVEAYMKKDISQGRLYFAVNGEVILDTDVYRPEGFTGRTQHATNPMRLHFWSAMKNYHDMRWNSQGPVSQWYDDIELWSSFPPGHPGHGMK